MAVEDARVIRADGKSIRTCLDQLDETGLAAPSIEAEGRDAERYSYRVRALTCELLDTSGGWMKYVVPTRNISRRGLSLIAGQFMYPGTRCRVHLLSIHHHVQMIAGTVVRCRYLPGTARMHEVGIAFNAPIDIALFHRGATEMRVMVADDDPIIHTVVPRLLSAMKLRFSFAHNGQEAVRACAGDAFDLILMDLDMPTMDGATAVREMRRAGHARAVIAMSETVNDELTRKCLEAGFTDLTVKPFTRDGLTTLLGQVRADPIVSSLVADRSMALPIDAFVAELRDRIREIEMAFAQEDAAAMEKVVRWIRATAGTHGFESLTQAAMEVEKTIADKADRVELRRKVNLLMRVCNAARPVTLKES